MFYKKFASIFSCIALIFCLSTGTSFGVSNYKILFGRSQGSNGGDIYLMDSDGQNITRLTTIGDSDSDGTNDAGKPIYCSLNNKVYFHSNKDGRWDWENLYRMDLDGSSMEALTTDDNRHWYYCIDEANQKIYYSHITGVIYIYSMDLDGGNKQRMSWGDRKIPSDIHDGKLLICPNQKDITVIDVSTGASTVILQDTSVDYLGRPTWSPDGNTIVFTKHQGTGRHELWLVDADGSNERKVPIPSDLYAISYYPRLTPDGSLIIFSGYTPGGKSDIYTVEPNGSQLTNITQTPDLGEAEPYSFIETPVGVHIPDLNLEAVLRETLGIPSEPLTVEALAQITELRARGTTGKKIEDLTGIGHCTNLEVLDLTFNRVRTFTGLSDLAHLWNLNFSSNELTNTDIPAMLGELAQLEELRYLSLGSNRFDITPLADLLVDNGNWNGRWANLEKLWLSPNHAIDGESLEDVAQALNLLPNFAALMLGGSGLDSGDIYGLTHLKNAEELSLTNNSISDISAFAGMESLKLLSASYNQVSYLSPLSDLEHLKYLYLSHNQVSDASPLLSFKSFTEGNLSKVYLDDNPLTPESLNVLRQLKLSGVRVKPDVPLNEPPTVDAGGPYSVNEGASVVVTAIGDDPGDSLTYAWDLDGDGTFETPGQPVTFSATSLDGPNTITITAQVTDTGGLTATDEAIVNVLNVAPTAGVTNDGPKPEGTAVSVTVSQTDPGTSDTFTYSFDWDNDGSYEIVDQASPSASNTWDDNGTYKVGVRVKDDDGDVGTATTDVTVINVAPTVEAGPDDIINEGSTFTNSGSFSDPGADTWTATVNYGDGTEILPLMLNPDSTFALNHVYGDNGAYTVTVTVNDDDEGVGINTVKVTVNNVAPTVKAGEDQTITAGDFATFSGTFSDPGWPDEHTAEWDYGDETSESGEVTEENDPPDATGTVTGEGYSYFNTGEFTVTLKVTDDDEGEGSDTLKVTVKSIVATIDFDPNY